MRRADRPRHASGVDASAAMLARVGPLRSGWEIVFADVGDLRLAAACFDVAIASYARTSSTLKR